MSKMTATLPLYSEKFVMHDEITVLPHMSMHASTDPFVSCNTKQETHEILDVVHSEIETYEDLTEAQKRQVVDVCTNIFGSKLGRAKLMQIPHLTSIHKVPITIQSENLGSLTSYEKEQTELQQEWQVLTYDDIKKNNVKFEGHFTCSQYNSKTGHYTCDYFGSIRLLETRDLLCSFDSEKSTAKSLVLRMPILGERAETIEVNAKQNYRLDMTRFNTPVNSLGRSNTLEQTAKLLAREINMLKQTGLVAKRHMLDVTKLDALVIDTHCVDYELNITSKALLMEDLANIICHRFFINIKLLNNHVLVQDLKEQRLGSSILEMIFLLFIVGVAGRCYCQTAFSTTIISHIKKNKDYKHKVATLFNWHSLSLEFVCEIELVLDKMLLLNKREVIDHATEQQLQEARILQKLMRDFFINKSKLSKFVCSNIIMHFDNIVDLQNANKMNVLFKLFSLRVLNALQAA